jgi:hypothetical protein
MFKRKDFEFELFDNPEQVTIEVRLLEEPLLQVTRYKEDYPSHSPKGIFDDFRQEFMKFVETDYGWVILNELQVAHSMANGIESLMMKLIDASEKKGIEAINSMAYRKVLEYEKNPLKHKKL